MTLAEMETYNSYCSLKNMKEGKQDDSYRTGLHSQASAFGRSLSECRKQCRKRFKFQSTI